MLPDYLIKEDFYSSIPNQESVSKIVKDISASEEAIKSSIKYISGAILSNAKKGNRYTMVYLSELKDFGFEYSRDAELIQEFMRSKGFTINQEVDDSHIQSYTDEIYYFIAW